jgi:hypothetical protein
VKQQQRQQQQQEQHPQQQQGSAAVAATATATAKKGGGDKIAAFVLKLWQMAMDPSVAHVCGFSGTFKFLVGKDG